MDATGMVEGGPAVLMIGPADLSGELGGTVLWRGQVRRVFAAGLPAALDLARLVQPRLLVLDAAVDAATTARQVHSLRASDATRKTAIAVLDRSTRFADEQALRAAGANVVLPVPVDPAVWDERLSELLLVPPRREVRLPVRIAIWTSPERLRAEGTALNLSVRGMLLETTAPLPVAARLDLSFVLPGSGATVEVVGEVVRVERGEELRRRFGVELVVHRGDARERIAAFVQGQAARAPDQPPAETREWEAELRASAARHAAILEGALDGIVTVDQEGRIREFNRAAEQAFGHRREEVLGHPAAEVLVPRPKRDAHRRRLRQWLSTPDGDGVEHRLETTVLHADGREIPVEAAVNAVTVKGRRFVTAFLRDISERRRTERGLACEHAVGRVLASAATLAAASGPLLATVCESHGLEAGALWTADPPSAVRCVDLWVRPGLDLPELAALDRAVAFPVGGLTAAAFLTREPEWIDDLESRRQFPRARIALAHGLRSAILVPIIRGQECLGVLELFAADVRPRQEPLLESLGTVARQLAQFLERRRAEKAHLVSEERFRAMVENNTDALAIVSPQGVLTYVSPSVQRVLGYAPGALSGRPALDLVHRDDRAAAQQALESSLSAPGLPVTALVRAVHADGTFRHLEGVVVNRIDNPALRALVANFRDVTPRVRGEEERARLEEQLRQALRIEAVGRLAGGVAHDFNNILGAILGYAGLALGRPELPRGVRRPLEQIQRAGQRGSDLTRQLLAFSRKQVLMPEVLDLREVVLGALDMLRRLIGEDVELVVEADAPAGFVQADPGQIEQVVMNLVVNARDAMPHGGRIRLSVREAVLDAAFVRDHVGSAEGPHVVLEIADDGVGMDEGVLARIFEPFFTTKEQGRGTGLGLATVYGIVKQSGGYIEVESASGAGSTFRVYLRRVEGGARPARPAARAPVEGGTETVLLVEDDQALRPLVRELLEEHGYAVIEAKDGREALAAAPGAGRIDLLLTDVVMPGLSGPALAEALRAERPALPVLFMSGYPGDAIARHGVLEHGVELLQKPFTVEALLERVRKVLDAAASAGEARRGPG